jgi:hypothetical protein
LLGRQAEGKSLGVSVDNFKLQSCKPDPAADSTGYWLTRWLIQRGLGLTYLIGFLLVVNQFRPILGEWGLLPAQRYMAEGKSLGVPVGQLQFATSES